MAQKIKKKNMIVDVIPKRKKKKLVTGQSYYEEFYLLEYSGLISQQIEIFIITAVKTSNVIYLL
jgi:hypothetical protein